MKLCSSLLIILSLLQIFISPGTVLSEEKINEVFLLERHDKLLAFSSLKNNWTAKDLHTGEKVVKSIYDGNVAVAYTTERALAFSAITGKWAEKRFRIRESVINISAEGNVGIIVTNIRALGFSARTGVLVESLSDIGE